ncbi:hypothetical protein A2U01_0075169, partial [Trifolium medium]|nr:hypothetical protein [Trifolium medium]
IVRKKIAHLEGELHLLQKRKRELDESISTDVFKLITKNRFLWGLEAHLRYMGGRLDEIVDDLGSRQGRRPPVLDLRFLFPVFLL